MDALKDPVAGFRAIVRKPCPRCGRLVTYTRPDSATCQCLETELLRIAYWNKPKLAARAEEK